MPKFDITYEIVTEESAEHGDAEERGFISEDVGLRTAVSDLGWPSQGFEPSEYPGNGFRWITACLMNDGTHDFYVLGHQESRSLHIPDNVTNASRARILRLVESGNWC